MKTYTYDSVGDITSKSDAGTYSYPAPGPSAVRPQAVTAVTGALNATYAYDAPFRETDWGNLTSGAGRTVTWTSFNMVATVQRGTNTLAFTYDAKHQRIKQFVSGTNETTIYINAEVRVERVLGTGGTPLRWNNYIYAPGSGGGGGMVAVFYDHESIPDQLRRDAGNIRVALHKDHLGSISAISDESGTVIERLAYDAWGMRRNAATWADDFGETIGSLTDRGYTGHEHLQEVGLVHMNGRIYDPRLGRFMSADPFVQDPFDTQALNRYSYVKNNPLAYTDPSGYFFKSIFRASGNFISNIGKNPQMIVAIAAAAVVTWGVGAVMMSAATQAAYATAGVVGNGFAVASTAFATAVVDTVGVLATGVGASASLTTIGAMTAAAAGGFAAGVISGGNLESGFKGAIGGGAMAGIGSAISGPSSGAMEFNPENVGRAVGKSLITAGVRSATDDFFRERIGLHGYKLDFALTVASFGGDAIYGSRYKGVTNAGNEFIDGILSRRGLGYSGALGFDPMSVPADLVDITLAYRGVPTASAWRYVAVGNRSAPLVGYSLGAADVNNLA